MIEPTEQVISEQPFVVRRRVRWGECDPAGVVYTGHFTDYLISVVTLFHQHLLGDFSEGYRKRLGIETPCKGMTLTFNRALWPNETFDMHARIARIGTSTYEVAVKASLPDGSPVFEGSFTPICIPAGKERHAMALPDALRERLVACAAADPTHL